VVAEENDDALLDDRTVRGRRIVIVQAPCSRATTTMFSWLVSPCSKAQVTRTRRLGTVLSEAHDGRDVAAFGDSPILVIR
jgi:hypothetical protein